MQSPLWFWATLQSSCSLCSGSAFPDSFDLVSPSSQHSQGRSSWGEHPFSAMLQPRYASITLPQSPVAWSPYVATPSHMVAGMSGCVPEKEEGTGYWCARIMPTKLKHRTAQIKSGKTTKMCCSCYDTYIHLFSHSAIIY